MYQLFIVLHAITLSCQDVTIEYRPVRFIGQNAVQTEPVRCTATYAEKRIPYATYDRAERCQAAAYRLGHDRRYEGVCERIGEGK